MKPELILKKLFTPDSPAICLYLHPTYRAERERANYFPSAATRQNPFFSICSTKKDISSSLRYNGQLHIVKKARYGLLCNHWRRRTHENSLVSYTFFGFDCCFFFFLNVCVGWACDIPYKGPSASRVMCQVSHTPSVNRRVNSMRPFTPWFPTKLHLLFPAAPFMISLLLYTSKYSCVIVVSKNNKESDFFSRSLG